MNSIVYFGDSNINGMRLAEILPDGYYTRQIWTPISGTLTLSYQSTATIVDTQTWEEIPLLELMASEKPEYMIINMGVNGISFMDEEYFVAEYTAMVEGLVAASPDTKIMLSSLYPVAHSYENQSDINNEKIDAANAWIYNIAEEQGLRYIDIASTLRGEDGSLPEHLHIGDGLHLTSEGYELVLEYVKNHGYE